MRPATQFVNTKKPLLGLLQTGQSLSTGDFGTPPILTTNVGGNVRLFDSAATYDITTPNAGTLSLVPLVSPMRSDVYGGGGGDVSQYPANIGGEDPDIATANTLAWLMNRKFSTTCVGQGGAGLSVIQKGGSGNAYNAGLYEMRAINRLAPAPGFQLWAAMITHGEFDAASSVASYLSFLQTMQSNLQTDIAAITGQSGMIPLFVDQQNSFPNIGSGNNNSCQAQANAPAASVGLIFGTCPKYWIFGLGYGQTDRAHLTNSGYRILGEKRAQAIYLQKLFNETIALIPTNIVRVGNVVTVSYAPFVAPLVFDTSLGQPHQSVNTAWAAGKGFELFAGGYGGTPVAISSCVISGTNVVITGASAPDTVAYAMTPDNAVGGTYTGGFPDGRCGCLRDSDPFKASGFPGASGLTLPNWAWAFVQGGL